MRGDGDQADYMLPPFAALNAWHGPTTSKWSRVPEALRLVLFQGEEFEYLSVNLTVFHGDVIDAKMADEGTSATVPATTTSTTLFHHNDWDYRGGPGSTLPDDYYYDVVIPRRSGPASTW